MSADASQGPRQTLRESGVCLWLPVKRWATIPTGRRNIPTEACAVRINHRSFPFEKEAASA